MLDTCTRTCTCTVHDTVQCYYHVQCINYIHNAHVRSECIEHWYMYHMHMLKFHNT